MDSESPSLVSSIKSHHETGARSKVSRLKSVSWIGKTLTQKSLDESESMLEQIRTRRDQRRAASSQDDSSQQHDDSSELDELATFRATTADSAEQEEAEEGAAGARRRRAAGREAPPPPGSDCGAGGDSPRRPAGQRRSSRAEFRSKLRQRVSKAESKGQGRAHRKSVSRQATRFDALREGGTSRPYEEYLASRAAKQTGPSATQAYDFFCRVWEAPGPPTGRRALTPPQSPRDIDEESGDSRPLVDIFGADLAPLTRHVPAEIASSKRQTEREAEIYFAPSMVSPPVKDRLPPGWQLYDPAEDGIYAEHRPRAASRNLHKLENRLLHQSGRGWFAEDGRLVCLTDPLTSRPHHHHHHHHHHQEQDLSEDILTDYIPPSSSTHQLQPAPTQPSDDQLRLQLHVHIVAVQLQQHPLLSREQAVAAALTQLLTEYSRTEADGIVERLTQRLWAVRRARDGVLAALEQQQPTEPSSQREKPSEQEPEASAAAQRLAVQRGRVERYVHSIQTLRQLRDQAAAHQRKLCRSILRRWRELKGLREDQTFASSSLRLVVSELGVDHAEEHAEWRRELQAELDELESEANHQHHLLMSSFRADLAAWKSRRRELAEAGGQQELGPRPQPPPKFDRHKTAAEVETRAAGNRRPPGEPRLTFGLLDTHPVTPTAACPKTEQQRRQAVSRCQLSVRTYLGNREVCRTKPHPLTQALTVSIDETFAVRLRHAPEFVQLWLCETQGLTTRVVSKLRLPLPASHVTCRTARPEWVPFWQQGDSASAAAAADLTRGRLQAALCWGVDEDTGQLLAPAAADGGAAPEAALPSVPDPNDPADLTASPPLPCAGGGDSARQSEAAEAAVDWTPGQDRFLAAASGPEASRRCRLLRLRDRGVPEFRHITMAPLREQQVPQQPFQTYERRLAARSDSADGEGATEAAAAGRRSVLQYQLRIKEMVQQRFRAARRYKRLEDVVREDQVPDIGTLGSVFGSMFSPRRPLNPARQQKKPRPVADLQGQELRLICHVVRAFNVPVRRDVDSAALKPDLSRSSAPGQATVGQPSLLPEVLVRPLVELTFQRNTVRSNVAEGPNPSWNQDLQLPVTLQSHASADVQCLEDTLHLSLQDELLVNLLEDERRRDTNVHQRIERRWLAQLRIPFSTLYLNGRVEGTFRLQTPALLIGYDYDSTAGGTVFHLPAGQRGTFVTMFITLEPPLHVPPMVQERLDTMESDKLLSHCDAWTRAYREQYPGRRVRCTVLDVTGRSALVCRYIRPLKPPDSILAGSANEDDQARLVARFVSLIPNVSDVNFFAGMYDLWTTCQEFLDMQAGDEEEHAILLCNYFLYLGKRAYLVLGTGIPEGLTAYVLTDEATDRWLWNPCSGERSSVTESYSYLQSVGCLISADNVWANTQPYARPSEMTFDVNLVREWRPLFSSRYPAPADLPSVQAAQLRYTDTDATRVQAESERLERRLKEHIQAWRQRTNWTPWNRSCSEALRRMLPLLERAAFTPAISAAQLADEQTRLLSNVHATYKVCGVPLNLPHTSTEAVVEALYALGVHRNDSKDTEFALAVHLEPYPSGVVSVWVYVAALTRRR